MKVPSSFSAFNETKDEYDISLSVVLKLRILLQIWTNMSYKGYFFRGSSSQFIYLFTNEVRVTSHKSGLCPH